MPRKIVKKLAMVQPISDCNQKNEKNQHETADNAYKTSDCTSRDNDTYLNKKVFIKWTN
jgi:hypothetical protein